MTTTTLVFKCNYTAANTPPSRELVNGDGKWKEVDWWRIDAIAAVTDGCKEIPGSREKIAAWTDHSANRHGFTGGGYKVEVWVETLTFDEQGETIQRILNMDAKRLHSSRYDDVGSCVMNLAHEDGKSLSGPQGAKFESTALGQALLRRDPGRAICQSAEAVFYAGKRGEAI